MHIETDFKNFHTHHDTCNFVHSYPCTHMYTTIICTQTYTKRTKMSTQMRPYLHIHIQSMTKHTYMYMYKVHTAHSMCRQVIFSITTTMKISSNYIRASCNNILTHTRCIHKHFHQGIPCKAPQLVPTAPSCLPSSLGPCLFVST